MPPSQRPYMGAIPFETGCTFRVWAPFAQQVSVAGDFNSWSTTAHALYSENNGYWSTDVDGVGVGSQYKFHLVGALGQPLWRTDPYARSVVHANGTLNSVIAATDEAYPTPGYSTPPWNAMVVYEMHIGSFKFDPTSPGGRGSFAAAIGKLDYLRDLGVNTIEVMALAEFEGDISWGYNPEYIFAIEDEYGGPNAFRTFVHEAHARGIAVIIDVVYNHLGFPSGDMWLFDGWSENNKGGIYFYNDWRSTTDWGETRFDYGRPEVRQYLRDNALRWLEQRFADGLRWDSVGSIRNVKDQNNDPPDDIGDGWSLMQRINSEIQQRQPWKISIAEDLKDNAWITRDIATGGAGFGSQWGDAFWRKTRDAIIGSDDTARDMWSMAGVISQTYNGNAWQRVIYTESHDADSNGRQRVPEEIWPGNAASYFSQKRSTLGAAVVLTAPGIPMLFMGQEFLEDGWFDNNPRELDWSKVATHAGIVQLYRDLIRLRRNWFNNTRGLSGQNTNVFQINDGAKVIALHRWDQGGPGDDVVVVLNFANQAYASYMIGLPRGGRWRVRFNSDWSGYSPVFGNCPSYDADANQGAYDNLPFSGSIGLGPYTAVVLSQD